MERIPVAFGKNGVVYGMELSSAYPCVFNGVDQAAGFVANRSQ
jgi:hypothetical protein